MLMTHKQSLTGRHAAGLMWACKRLGPVRKLHLLDSRNVISMADCHLPRMRLTRLQWIVITLPEAAANKNAWFTWFLAQAPNLMVLSCKYISGAWFPPLFHVKHLDLTVKTQSAAVACGALACAEGLVTLRLAAEPLAGSIRVPELHLGCVDTLQTLVLDKIWPADLQLPECCNLGVYGAIFPSQGWDIAPEYFHMISLSTGQLVSRAFPDLFPRMCNLDTLIVYVPGAGDPRNLVSLEPLAHVRRLYLRGEKLYLKIPGRVSWVHLVVTCTSQEQLMLAFDDVHGFASTVHECCLSFASLRGAWLADLCSALSSKGVGWSTVSYSGTSTFQYPAVCRINSTDCICGACIECLERCLPDDRA